MKLIDLLQLMQEPNASGYVRIIHADNSTIESTAERLYKSLAKNVLDMDVTGIKQGTRVNTFPVLTVYVEED